MPLINPKVGDPNVVQSWSVRRDTDATTTSTTFSTLLSLSVNTEGSTHLLIWVSFTPTFTPSVSNDSRFRLRVDGTEILRSGEEEFTIAQSAAMVYRAASLASGAHTVDVQWRIGSAGEGTLRCRPSVPPEGCSIFALEVRV
jgi:hypothetical protein